jgi:hypothetical protein
MKTELKWETTPVPEPFKKFIGRAWYAREFPTGLYWGLIYQPMGTERVSCCVHWRHQGPVTTHHESLSVAMFYVQQMLSENKLQPQQGPGTVTQGGMQ